MAEFPHLTLVQKLSGLHKPVRGRGNSEIDARTSSNLKNRQQHGRYLSGVADAIKVEREAIIEKRRVSGLPDMPGANAIPVFLQVDTTLFNIESLKGLGIEIISEETDGFIIGASADGFTALQAKIEKFVKEEGISKNQAAQLWQIVEGIQWRSQQILSAPLFEKWNALQDDDILTVDVSVACYVAKPDYPMQKEGEDDEHYNKKLSAWHEKVQTINLVASDLQDERQENILWFLGTGDAEVNPNLVSFEDSFCFRVTLSKKYLKDFVDNYPFVFEVVESPDIECPILIDGVEVDTDIELLSPPEDAPRVCIIDSGIQENHRLLAPAILFAESMNYDTFDNTKADLVSNGGHGTRVAGAVLYGENIPIAGQVQLHAFLYNARVLNRDNKMSSRLYQPHLMEDIVYSFNDARIFNMSITSTVACRTVHMSPWAAKIDELIHDLKILFVVSAGNIVRQSAIARNPGIIEHLAAGRNYPDYLLTDSCRIADPAQSKFAITVGSVCLADFEDLDRISFGKRDQISSFSRTGPGMWGGLKPEVVEYGGDWVREKAGPNLSYEDSLNPLLVRVGGRGVDRGTVGTSFSAPKVTHILSHIQSAFPEESTLLYKALVIQSARLPGLLYTNPTLEALRMFGYGIPNLQRSIENSERRVTLVESSEVSVGNANLYNINIPEALRRQGEDYDILIEVTLVFTASPRRTRRKTQSYLSAWLSWDASKRDESFDAFKIRVLKNMEDPEVEVHDSLQPFPWAISSNPLWGRVKGIKRQDSATQKDWAIVKSNSLPEQISFAVIGHKGWEKDLSGEIPFSIVVSLEVLGANLSVYENIRVSNQVEVEQEINVIN